MSKKNTSPAEPKLPIKIPQSDYELITAIAKANLRTITAEISLAIKCHAKATGFSHSPAPKEA